jgi:hypothetical protein
MPGFRQPDRQAVLFLHRIHPFGRGPATGAVFLGRKCFKRPAAEIAGAETLGEVVGNADGHGLGGTDGRV